MCPLFSGPYAWPLKAPITKYGYREGPPHP
jgi:hypothetical protein